MINPINKKRMKQFVVAMFFGVSTIVCGQEPINGGPIHSPSPGVIDGVVIPEHIPTKRMIPYEYVREADLVWSRRVWEYIDLREKINHPLYYPHEEYQGGQWIMNTTRWSLWSIIRENVMNGNLTVYSPFNPALLGFGGWDGDQLKYPIVSAIPGGTYENDPEYRERMVSYLGYLGPEGTDPLIDEDPNSPNYGYEILDTMPDGTLAYRYSPPDTFYYQSKDIVQYKIKEDWFFDKERSVLDVRIIALAPVIYERDPATGTVSGMSELMWLYFPECRFVFNNYFTYNDKNDSYWMSFDDLFWKRKFNAVVYKVSNNFDRKIESYRTGIDALMESNKIKEEIRLIEHDVWSF